MATGDRDFHRIGGGAVDNLQLKPREAKLTIPGISVLRAASPQDAADQIRTAFPKAKGLHEAAKIVGSSSGDLIRQAGFDTMHTPSELLPNHHRIIHRDGLRGFSDKNLERLSQAFENTSGN